MDVLLTDSFRRRLVQVVLAILFALLCLPSPLLLLVLVLNWLNLLDGWSLDFAGYLTTFLGFPLNEAPAQLASIFVATLPAVVAIVCYEVDTGTGKATATLNGLGKAVLILLVAGIACTLPLMLVFSVFDEWWDRLSTPDAAPGVQLVITGILSFQILYILKLLGLENATPRQS